MKESLLQKAQKKRTASRPSIEYAEIGQGERILFIIGFSMRADIWRPQIEELGGTHHIAWYDNRGIAGSETGTEILPSMKDFAADGLRVLDSLEWDTNVHLVGVSMGGMIAQELALMAPSRFRSLTLIATNPGGSFMAKIPPWQGVLRFVGSFWLPRRFRSQSISGLLYPKHFLKQMNQRALKQRIELQLGRPAPKDVILKQLLAVMRFDVTHRLDELTLPTLILRPGEDILVEPKHSIRLMDRLPNARLVSYEDAGHGLIFQYAQEVNAEIAKHVADNRGALSE